MKIEGIIITPDSILNCYKMFYPKTYAQMLQNKFEYVELFGIRVSTCDTSLPDDLVGGIKVNKLNMFEVIISSASTEPSPFWLQNLMKDAKAKGGAAFVAEGQYLYKYAGKNKGIFAPYPCFAPAQAVKVYRWTPSAQDIKEYNNGKGKPLSSSFEEAVRTKSKNVKISTSSDVFIHRSWSDKKLFKDSAGCQIVTDRNALNVLGQWAVQHQKKGYGNSFQYTLFTKDQFLKANTSVTNFLKLR